VGRVCRNPTEPLVFKSVPDYCNQNAAPGAVDAHAKGGEMERINIAEKFAASRSNGSPRSWLS
jgi:hypothetical protein